jgi:hypothetical protein
MSEVRLGLGPSLLEKEKRIQELSHSNEVLREKLNLTVSCLEELETKAKDYAD